MLYNLYDEQKEHLKIEDNKEKISVITFMLMKKNS